MSDYRDFYEQHTTTCDYCTEIMENPALSKDVVMELVDMHATLEIEKGQPAAEAAWEAFKEENTWHISNTIIMTYASPTHETMWAANIPLALATSPNGQTH